MNDQTFEYGDHVYALLSLPSAGHPIKREWVAAIYLRRFNTTLHICRTLEGRALAKQVVPREGNSLEKLNAEIKSEGNDKS